MEFNIADLFECVADAVPDREAVVVRRRAPHLRASSTSARPGSRTRCRRRGRVGDHVGLLPAQLGRARRSDAGVLQGAGRPDQRQLPLRRRRAAVLAATTPTSSRCVHDADTAAHVDALRTRIVRSSSSVRPSTRRSSQSGSPARDFGPRSADDHYVLYTGGTTGRPKGVVWRQEDIFFGGARQREPGRPADHRARADRAHRCSTIPPNDSGAFLPPGDPGPTQFVSLALGPLMHASGQWSALGTLLGGGKVVLVRRAATSTWIASSTSSNASASNACNLVGDASARPAARRARRPTPDRWDTVVAAAARVGRQHPVGRREGRA